MNITKDKYFELYSPLYMIESMDSDFCQKFISCEKLKKLKELEYINYNVGRAPNMQGGGTNYCEISLTETGKELYEALRTRMTALNTINKVDKIIQKHLTKKTTTNFSK